MRVAQFNRWLMACLLATTFLYLSGRTVVVQASDYDDNLPIPVTKDGQDNYPLGVASYYGVFAGGDLTVGTSNVEQLEGRFASQTFNVFEGAYNNGAKYFEVAKAEPVIVSNKVGDNALSMVNARYRFAEGNENQIVANNVAVAIKNNQLGQFKLKYPYPEIDNSTLKSRTSTSLVSEVTDFKDNQSKLIGAVSRDGDDSSYFTAATEQLKKISAFYASFTSEEKPVSYSKDTVDSASVIGGTGANPIVNINLKTGYTENYAEHPPLIFVNLSGKPTNVTINITNQDATIKSTKAIGNSDYETYAYSPYIFLNWTKTPDFTADSQYKIIVNGTANPDDGTNRINKLISGHIMNNFANATGEFKVEGQDVKQLMAGTILTPNVSQFTLANRGDGANFFGNIITGGKLLIENNITAERSLASHFDADGLSTDTIEKLDPNNPANLPQQLASVILKNGNQQQTVKSNQTVTFNYDDATSHLQPLPNSGIQTTVNITNPADQYHLFYRVITNGNKGKWHQYQANLSGESVTIPDLEAVLSKDSDYQITPQSSGAIASVSNVMGYQMQRQNQIEFGIAPTTVTTADLDTTGSQLSSQLTFNLAMQGSLQVSVPNSLDFGTEQLGQTGHSDVKMLLNTISLKQLKVANHGTAQQPEIAVYNPLQAQYQLHLGRLTAGDSPFNLPNNLLYQLSGETSGYIPMVDPNNQSPIGVMADAGIGGHRSVPAIVSTQRYLYFRLPFSNHYSVGTYTADFNWRLSI